MSHRRIRNISNLHKMFLQSYGVKLNKSPHLCALFSSGSTCVELPRKLIKSERKPMVTSVNQLKRQARLEKHKRLTVKEVTLTPPENGLLVKRLILIAHQVLAARAQLFPSLSRAVASIPVYSCSLCGEVHVGHPPHKIKTCNVAGSPKSKEHVWERGGMEHVLPVVESFHLYDRIGRAVTHNEQLLVDRIPAIVELCIQAGVDIPEYPVRRRDFPVYQVAGRMMDFERRFPHNNSSIKEVNTYGFWGNKRKLIEDKKSLSLPYNDIQGFATRGMEAWEKMRAGAIALMKKYSVQTCGYCPEVQVGPMGHRVRQCYAYKHQMRDGQHAWQEATIDDLIPPVYVWHVQDPQHHPEPLVDGLRRYYGKLPAVVELFAQAGARVGDGYSKVMREDIAVPELNEEKLVV
ncbi:hypothetical protein LguiA_012669 [Lonicera macranthoides]